MVEVLTATWRERICFNFLVSRVSMEVMARSRIWVASLLCSSLETSAIPWDEAPRARSPCIPGSIAAGAFPRFPSSCISRPVYGRCIVPSFIPFLDLVPVGQKITEIRHNAGFCKGFIINGYDPHLRRLVPFIQIDPQGDAFHLGSVSLKASMSFFSSSKPASS